MLILVADMYQTTDQRHCYSKYQLSRKCGFPGIAASQELQLSTNCSYQGTKMHILRRVEMLCL